MAPSLKLSQSEQKVQKLNVKVESLQTSIKSWEVKLNVIHEAHKSLVTKNDAKLKKMATKLKVIRAKMKVGNKKMKELESRLKTTVAVADDQEKEDLMSNIDQTSCAQVELADVGIDIGSVEEENIGANTTNETTHPKVKRKRKRDLASNRKKLKNNHGEIDEEMLNQSQPRGKFDKTEDSPSKSKHCEIAVVASKNFRKKEVAVYIQRVSESEILKYSTPNKNRSGNVVDSVMDRRRKNSQNEAVENDFGGALCGSDNTNSANDLSASDENREAGYKCPICDRVLKTRSGCVDHKNYYHRTPEDCFRCPTCPSSIKWKRNLDRHIKTLHKNDHKHECNICHRRFIRKENLVKHKLIHTNENATAYVCHVCAKAYSNNQKLIKHVSRHQNTCTTDELQGESSLPEQPQSEILMKSHNCAKCSKNYPSSHELDEHLKLHTSKELKQLDNSIEKSVQLNSKSKVASLTPGSSKVKENTSLKIADKAGSTTQDSKTVKPPPLPKVHEQTHEKSVVSLNTKDDDDKGHKCPTCNKTFSQKRNLEAHKKLHARVITVDCIICSKKMKKASLPKHLDTVHPKKIYTECPVCQLVYFGNSAFRRHFTRHKVSSLHKCKKCCKTFPDRHKYNEHTVDCIDIKLNQSLSTSSNISKNDKTTTADSKKVESPKSKSIQSNGKNRKTVHKCVQCRQNLSSSASLSRHLRNVHRKAKSPAPMIAVKNKIVRKIFARRTSNPIPIPKIDKEKDKDKINENLPGISDSNKVTSKSSPQLKSPQSPSKSFKCTKCSNTYTRQDSVRRHLRLHHSKKSHSKTKAEIKHPGGRYAYACNFCKELHKTWTEFEDHMESHKDIFSKIRKLPPPSRGKPSITKSLCSQCNKAYESIEILRAHFARNHAWKKPYKCKFCTKSFCTNDVLKRHIKSHGTVSRNLDLCDD